MTWIMAIIYPIIVIFIVDDVRFINYFRQPEESFSELGTKLGNLALADLVILGSGLAGAILSGIVMRILRAKGYRMF